jgi:hypothetical protein
LIFLFITTVCGSSLKTAYPLYNAVQKQENQKKVIEILKSQVNDNNKSLDTFVMQNQRVNAALSVRNQIKIKEELKQLLNNQKSAFGLWLEISVVILIRFGVQLANLSCIWLAGWLYRQPQKTKAKQSIQRQNAFYSENDLKSNHVEMYSQKTQSQTQNTGDIPNRNVSSKQTNQKAFYQNGNSLCPKSNRETALKKKPDLKSPDTIDKPFVQKKELEGIYDLRIKIAQLLRSRNEGISLSDIGKAIGEREASLRDIINPKSIIGHSTMLALKSILTKIENLYNEEQARMS